jgi:hypothetical protein
MQIFLNGNTIDTEHLTKKVDKLVREDDPMVFYWQGRVPGKNHGDVSYLLKSDNTMMKLQMLEWRKSVKAGKIMIQEENHRTFQWGGKDFYGLIVQYYDPDPDSDEEEEDGEKPLLHMCDPISMAKGYMCSGFGYYFHNKQNRDAIAKFVMTGKR